MSKSQLNIRISNDLATALDKEADSTGKTKTTIVSDALSVYLSLPKEVSDIDTISNRLEQLERKVDGLSYQPKRIEVPKEVPLVDAATLGDLITLDEIASLTGYTKSTLSSKMSRENIQAIRRVGGNKAGLYDKNEIMDKIGHNPIR